MEIVKMFTADEIEDATGIDPCDVKDYPGNDCAIRWWAELEEISPDMNDNDKKEIAKRNKITEYITSQGVEEGEKVWIDITW